MTENDMSHITLLLMVVFPIDLSTCSTPEYPVVTYKFSRSGKRQGILFSHAMHQGWQRAFKGRIKPF